MDALNLVLGDPLLAPVVEFGRAHVGVASHVLRILERAAVLEIRRDAGAAHRVAAHQVRGEACAAGPALDHRQGVVPVDRAAT